MHSQRAQRVPTTGLALALVHREVVLALVRLLERPSAAASRFSSTIAIRFGDAIVGLRAGRAKVASGSIDGSESSSQSMTDMIVPRWRSAACPAVRPIRGG